MDCEACIPECPVEAIYFEDDVPEPWQDYIELNREMVARCPQITEKKSPLRL
ncbi:MAG: ferredoxin [Planctomycetota bacterium]|nr:ferredoxin [Planctomycetota bacterium]MDA1165918.1 ferredoxin [Planctomycetota bacterium]